VNLCVALSDRGADHFLNTFRLKPWLSVSEVITWLDWVSWNVVVSSHERIENSKLVELDPEIIRRFTVESGNVATTENYSWNTKWKQHIDWHFNVFVVCLTVSSPHCTVTLTSQEERSCQHEWSILTVISLIQTCISWLLLKSAISIVYIHVHELLIICSYVNIMNRHSSLLNFFKRTVSKNGGLIHIIPCSIEVVLSVEAVVSVETLPILLSICVQEVNPDWGTRPAVSNEVTYTIWLANVDVSEVRRKSTCFLLCQSIIVNVIAGVIANMWVFN